MVTEGLSSRSNSDSLPIRNQEVVRHTLKELSNNRSSPLLEGDRLSSSQMQAIRTKIARDLFDSAGLLSPDPSGYKMTYCKSSPSTVLKSMSSTELGLSHKATPGALPSSERVMSVSGDFVSRVDTAVPKAEHSSGSKIVDPSLAAIVAKNGLELAPLGTHQSRRIEHERPRIKSDSRSEQASMPPRSDMVGEREIASIWRRTENALSQAATNRGRETNAFKALHDYLTALNRSSLDENAKLRSMEVVFAHLSKIKDWDQAQWFRREPSNWRDPSGRRMTEYEFICERNRLSAEQMKLWDDWAEGAAKPFRKVAGSASQRISALDNYLVERVSVDSVKNWLRRRPDEPFINDMFAALAENRLYIDDPNMRLRSLKDENGQVRMIENRDGKLFFEGSEDAVPIKTDERGAYVDLPSDTDLVVFERRTVRGERKVVPLAQPNDRDPNIQWFGGEKVKLGWEKEQRFLQGPNAFSTDELYGFFPDHFPMRITNSAEGGKPTEKTGAAIYGYARDHAGRLARQLIADYGIVMDGLKRNNSQLINDSRNIFGLQRFEKPRPVRTADSALEFDNPFRNASSG